MVRNKFVGMEELTINAIWDKFEVDKDGMLSRSEIRKLLIEHLKEVSDAIPQLISNSFKQRNSDLKVKPGAIEAVVSQPEPDRASIVETQMQVEIREQQAKVSEMIGDIEELTEQFMRKMDRNNDGRVMRGEFFSTFRTLLYTTADSVRRLA
mmetsp:Transcript_10142/g.18466  ORF Transcript_10142/g.18466 Transcript_10142/m.18466 type:complete len:152 (+) Transcript_10142:164-619(+)